MRAYSGLIAEVEKRVRSDMREFDASRSMVIAVALGLFYGVKEQERFEDDPRRLRRRLRTA